MAALDDVKKSLRISSSACDGEISDLIAAAKADLGLAGICADIDPPPALLKMAIVTYCKAHFGYDDKSDKFAQSYDSLKKDMALSKEYTEDD